MIQINQNNWWYWTFNNEKYGDRVSNDDTWSVHFEGKIEKLLSFREETIKAAKSTRDAFLDDKFTLLLSGGSESEMIFRSFVIAGIDFDVAIIKYENNINSSDVYYATKLCNAFDKSYKIIDFNLKKFYENDIDLILDITQIERPRMLPQVVCADLVDGIPICGGGDPHWIREHSDYTKSAKWYLQEFEHELGWDRYFIKKDRQAIMHWFRWTPELVLSYTNMNWFINLTSNNFFGKLGNWSTKLIGYTEQFPEITQRVKQTGFEGCEELIEEVQKYIHTRNNGISFFTDCKIDIDILERMYKCEE